jgi:AcrR family transcriptional regulator
MTADVRTRLLDSAEALIAERGLEGVSLREITATAGAGNASAVQYHFGGRAGLVRAVVERHHPAVEARRHALLDQYEADGQADLRTLAGALVRPLAAELGAAGGPGYLQLLADLATRPHPAIAAASIEDPTDSTFRWRAAVEPLLDADAVRLHRRFTAIQFTLTELARRGRDALGRGAHERDNQLFVSHLIDLVTALLAAPVSAETERLVARRSAQIRAT